MDLQRSLALRVMRGELSARLSAAELVDFVDAAISLQANRMSDRNSSRGVGGSGNEDTDRYVTLLREFCDNIDNMPWVG